MASIFARSFGLAAGLALPTALLAGFGAAQSGPAASTGGPVTTEMVTTRLAAAIENLRTLRCNVRAQERVGNKYNQARTLMKLTFKPLRVYLKNQRGIEVLYVTGQNGGDAWVYPNSFPYMTLSLDPNGAMMRRNQHHTALQAGFGMIADLLKGSVLRQDNAFGRSFRYVGDSLVQGRSCYVLRSEFPQFKYVSYKVGKNETLASVADRFGCGEFRIMERNNLGPNDKLPEGKVLQVPNAYARRTIVPVDPKTFLPAGVAVYDDRGLFEKFEFSDVVANQPIPLEEFSRDYKDYKL